MSRLGLINKLKTRFGETPADSDTAATNIGGDIYDETTDVTKLSDADGDTYIEVEESADDDHIRIYTAGTERVTIDDSGNVGIGTTDIETWYSATDVIQLGPDAVIIGGETTGWGLHLTLNAYYDTGWKYRTTDEASDFYLLNDTFIWRRAASGTIDTALTWTIAMTLNSTGLGIGKSPGYQLELSTDSAGKPSTNTWTIVSDERVKKNIESFNDGLKVLLSLEPIKFEYNGKGGYNIEGQQIGFNATEEIKKNKAPYLFGIYKAKLNENDEEETELLNYNGHALPFILLNSIKELKEIIDKQQKVIHNFEKRLKHLEKKDEK